MNRDPTCSTPALQAITRYRKYGVLHKINPYIEVIQILTYTLRNACYTT